MTQARPKGTANSTLAVCSLTRMSRAPPTNNAAEAQAEIARSEQRHREHHNAQRDQPYAREDEGGHGREVRTVDPRCHAAGHQRHDAQAGENEAEPAETPEPFAALQLHDQPDTSGYEQ